MKIEPLYVVDTHALIWYLINSERLGSQAKTIFAAAEQGETYLLISAIVAAEIYYANVKNGWFPNFDLLYQQLQARPYFRFVDFQPDHVLDFNSDSNVPEMHDRIIAGLARRMNAPLITFDSQITRAGIIPVIW